MLFLTSDLISNMSNPQDKDFVYQSAKKQLYSSYKKSYLTHSKQKDKINITDRQKKRHSARVSIIGHFAKIKIYHPNLQKNICKSIHNLKAQKQDIDPKIADKVQQYTKQLQINQRQISNIIDALIETQKMVKKTKQISQTARNNYHNTQKINQYLQLCNKTEQLQQFELKNEANNLSYNIKKQFYELGAQQNQIITQKSRLEQLIEAKRDQFNQKMQQIQQITERLLLTQQQNKQYNKEYREVQQKNKEIKIKQQLDQSHIFILRFQINSNLYGGFIITSKSIDKKLLFDSDYRHWERSKQRKITTKDVKRFILIQLYKGWKTLIRKLSYQSSQYQVLFGEKSDQNLVNSLKNMIYGQEKRVSTKKINKTILISSIHYQNIIKQICHELQGFNNGIIQITKVSVEEKQKLNFLEIIYNTVDQCDKIETYEIRTQEFIPKQQLSKLIRQSDRKICYFIEIPLFIHKSQWNKYQEVYDLIRKRNQRP